ncbi:ATP-dependent DNA helicase sgs1 [Puccinia graminis f. sp. tritici]|uniref:DNA 3'-5' helicase n=1 Tax=Puccinia graminis f. sp. tritici TaxID=56615 RepID=A0A5B0Q073_PUCGR|nr:ATP-dependent DNA helicase sgs1 [Puccinia graminis f. sp. tritici]
MDGSSLAISVQDPKDAHVETTTLRPTRDTEGKKPLQLNQEIIELDNNKLIDYVKDESKKHYKEAPKKLQVDTVCNLARGYHSFVLAGTGYGKSRIAELYFHLYAPQKKPVVLVLNPLDSLGEDQVREKTAAGIKAISLGKMKMTEDLVKEMKAGDYAFIYLSPEVFLNNSLFTELYFSSEFQNRLVLIVLDKAHMVYVWGLVESGKAKFLSVRDRLQDYGIFRPSYGKLGDRLMATNNVPLLLLSATCRPVAVESILGSLMLKRVDITFFHGELVRPEIRILRFYMEYPLKSCDDLLRMFSPESDIKNREIVPMLIYSGTQKATLSVISVINKARGKKKDAYDSESRLVRRYHACTGDEDKLDCVKDFENDKFPVFSSTMALGLGQNWKRVQCVVHLG